MERLYGIVQLTFYRIILKNHLLFNLLEEISAKIVVALSEKLAERQLRNILWK